MKRALALGCGILSWVLFVATDIIGARRYPGYSLRDQNFSELTAEGSPVRPFMVAANCLPYGALMTAFSVGVKKSRPEPAGRTTAVMLAAYGLANMTGGAVFPMPTRQALAAKTYSPINTLHIPVMSLMTVFLLVAVRSGATLLGSRFRIFSYATIAGLVLPWALVSRQVSKVPENEPTPWMGFHARINIAATMLWIAAFALSLMRVGKGGAAPFPDR